MRVHRRRGRPLDNDSEGLSQSRLVRRCHGGDVAFIYVIARAIMRRAKAHERMRPQAVALVCRRGAEARPRNGASVERRTTPFMETPIPIPSRSSGDVGAICRTNRVASASDRPTSVAEGTVVGGGIAGLASAATLRALESPRQGAYPGLVDSYAQTRQSRQGPDSARGYVDI